MNHPLTNAEATELIYQYNLGRVGINEIRRRIGVTNTADDKVLGYDENTLFKIFDALKAAGLSTVQTRDCITDMQNRGIYFREMIERDKIERVMGPVAIRLLREGKF